MKKFILSILLGILAGNTHAQDDITLFFLNDGSFKGFYDEEIDSITYSHLDLDSIWHNDAVVQEVWLGDSVVRIPIESIDSICHKVPEPVYKPNVIRLDESYLDYITSVDGLSITFSSGLPENMRPHIGDVIVYEGSCDLFPEGFAGKVVTEGRSVVCEEAEIPDIYDKFVFFGSYIMQQIPDEAVPSYALRRIKNRTQKKLGNSSHIRGHEDDIDWRSGGFKADDIGIGTIKRAYKIELKKIHTQLGAEISVTPVISIELYWDSYVYSPYLFYKRTVNVNYVNKYLLKYSRDTKPESDDQKSFWNSFWKGVEPSWFDTTYGYMDDPNDDEDSQSLYVIDEEVPLPDCPLLKVGVQLGIFCQPKLEGEVSVGFETSGEMEKTYIYSSRNGSTESESKTSNNEFVLEGSVKGSLWAGLVAGLHVSLGLGKGKRLEGVEEEAKFKIGPYIEGEIKADFADAIADKSVYSLVKDSKVKTGWKLGLDFKFKAKLAGGLINFNWDQFSWSPENLIDERNIYFFPKFEAPSYTTDGNSLRCSSIVSRQTFNNKIGFVLLKEDGSEQDRKYLDESYSFMNDDVKYSNDEHPFSMTLTFDNLDFANHRYTIVPCTRLFGFECLGLQMPEEQHTVVLCPNSNHPHLIDMGLPSGTKWLCTNVYSNAPEDAGGYYQWGKPYMVHAYTDATYRAPNISMANYQSSEYDAATVKLGQEYCTPTMSQFLELHDNCSMDYKYSTWGKNVLGVFLKGKNGNNLYLPYSGFKSGVKVNNSSEGWFLSSDAVDSNNKLERKAVVLKNDDVIWGSSDALANGHSVRPVSSRNDGLMFEPQQLDFEVYVGQKIGQYVTIINNGSAPVNITVAQTIAPFQVDDSCLGTFSVQPKEQYRVLVYFSPIEEKEYTSTLTLSYGTGKARVVSKVPLYGKGIKMGYLSCPDDDHPHMIDLGLPSRTMWACCNIGTESPEKYGGYYAWGELMEKDSYTTSNYSLSSVGNMHDLTAEEDVATVTWGSKWRMPTMDEFKEMLNHCSWSWEEYNEVIGARVTGPNGGSIFLPAAAMKDDSQYTTPPGTYGSYWGRTHATSSSYATELVFGIAHYSQNYQLGEFYYEMGPTGTRQTGRSVRAVRTERYIDGNDYTIYISNPSFDNNFYGAWEGTLLSGVNPDNNAEHYNKTYNTYQTITGLPAGKYKVGVQGFYRKGLPDEDFELWQSGDTANNNALIYANSSEGSYSIPFVPASSAALPESLGGKVASVGNGLYIPDDMVAAGAWFAAGYYHNYLEVEVGNDGVLTVGIKKDTNINADWTIIDNWTLIRLQ